MEKINVLDKDVRLYQYREEDYISLTDIAKYRDKRRGDYLIQNWLRSRNTIEFLGMWEMINNPNFNSIEFDGFRKKAGLNSFVLTPTRWVEKARARGIISKAGRYGGTYAHKDIAFEFASWISVEFRLYLIKEFQRLKEEEGKRSQLDWNIKRNLAKINYRIHTDAIKQSIIPKRISKEQERKIYADKADVLNVALFSMTAKEWREKNEGKDGNMRDYATISQLICLSNLESLNSVLVTEGITQQKRLAKLNEVAISQMSILAGVDTKKLHQLKK